MYTMFNELGAWSGLVLETKVLSPVDLGPILILCFTPSPSTLVKLAPHDQPTPKWYNPFVICFCTFVHMIVCVSFIFDLLITDCLIDQTPNIDQLTPKFACHLSVYTISTVRWLERIVFFPLTLSLYLKWLEENLGCIRMCVCPT